jgi:hypothetical protein
MQQAGLAHIYQAHADESPPLSGTSPEIMARYDWRSPQTGMDIRT